MAIHQIVGILNQLQIIMTIAVENNELHGSIFNDSFNTLNIHLQKDLSSIESKLLTLM